MAYLALYRKWRPSTFNEVVGQKHISIPILRALEQGRLAHAYLFSGPRGTGKTSMARILAKAVNCLHLKNGNPCNECSNCKEINTGSSLDVYEIDGASARGVDEIRVLRESVRTLPAAGNKKVYIIDEVHMLTKEAFNALLKTLEEPPSHVLFILATTEPEKIPLTILSRCQRYEFHRISVNDIKEHLLYISKESNLHLTPEAADLIAVRAEGGLRDALSLLDQCSGASEGKELSAEIVYNLLGLTGKDQIIDLAHAIISSKSGETLQLFYDILQEGKEPAAVLRDLLEHFRSLMICKINPEAPELSAYGNKLGVLKEDALRLSNAYLDALFDALHQSFSDTKRSSSPRMNAEMGLIRLCHLRGSRELNSLVERIEALEKTLSQLEKGDIPSPKSKAAPAPSPAPAIPSLPVPAPDIPAVSTSIPVPETDLSIRQTSTPEVSTKNNQINPVPPQSDSLRMDNDSIAPVQDRSPLQPSKYADIWVKVLSHLKTIHRIDIWTCLQKSSLIFVNPAKAVAAAPQQYLVMAGNNKSYQKIIAEAFEEATGFSLEFRSVLKGSPEEADFLAQAKKIESSAENIPLSPSSAISENDGYRLIGRDEIPQKDQDTPALSEALKMISNCDIYEKR